MRITPQMQMSFSEFYVSTVAGTKYNDYFAGIMFVDETTFFCHTTDPYNRKMLIKICVKISTIRFGLNIKSKES